MARLIPVPGQDGRGTTHFKAVDEHGKTLAVGNLEVEMIPGATRHGSLQFIIDQESVSADPTQSALQQQVEASQ